jgi:hypothetical protein
MIEACTMKKSGNGYNKISPVLHEIIVSTMGDNNIEQIGNTTKIDPVLRLYPDAQFMCTNNDDLDKGRGNGTLCRFVSVKLKNGAKMKWKNWDGRKVNTVTSDQVEWLKFQHWPEPPPDIPRFFKLKTKKFNTVVKELPIPGTSGVTIDIGNVIMHQFPVNSNIATTGHKLQGMSKDILIVSEWGTFPNWIYVVLSRVRKLAGLFILKKINSEKLEPFRVPKELIDFEQQMREVERDFICATDLVR